ncbi:hypothetical protein L21SP5_01719 [Salinivirga cyanobacteriivorans]|uniref:6-bladed beta-propeller n=1 Tax=Salinivirga cyanobacteriivorans TaxID=1307839 RepID=A0A0S2HZB4_9BACT|nr:hypothetical protein [Salinivirga cyanobacteriivorans]ALO15361.1 hypothetical protein L21SP5_01719 [Salinivirga cyanobacteriivorans]
MKNMFLKYSLVILTLIATIGCNQNEEKQFFKEPVSRLNVKIDQITVDSFFLEKNTSSYVGFLQISNDQLFFIDQKFCKVFQFDTTGRYIDNYLKTGKGPGEINTGEIATACFTKELGVFIGKSYDVHVFTKNWAKVNNFLMDWQTEHSRGEMLKNYQPDMPGLYNPVYYKFILRKHNDNVFFPIQSQHPEFNFVESRDYYKSARVLAKLNLKTGKVIDLLGRFSPVYGKFNNIGQFSLVNFDIGPNGDFYLSYEADSVIYQYDADFNIKKAFGFKGKEIEQGYKEILNRQDFQHNYKKQRETKGYYTWIEYIAQRDLLFRSYQKSGTKANDGLQIYKKNTLIGDVEIPKGMRVLGYIEPYFYSSADIDEMGEKIKVYRFKLPL